MSRANRFDRGDFETRYANDETQTPDASPVSTPSMAIAPATPSARGAAWPIRGAQLERVGESVLKDRDGKGRPHKGIDLFAAAGSDVLSSTDGLVLRVVDGRNGETVAQRRAGLFVDVRSGDGFIYRYLHLGVAQVTQGQSVTQGSVIGKVAAAFTSGLRGAPHLHFEIRQGDYDSDKQDYGRPVDPARRLPPLRA